MKRELHASGHISQEELKEVIEKIDLDYIIPLHTEKPEWFGQIFGKRTVLLRNGESWEV